MYVLGISAFYHDSAACLLLNGEIIAAAQEERFTRKRHDPSFPAYSIRFCLNKAGIQSKDLTAVVFYDKPFTTFERLVETYLHFAPKGLQSFLQAMPVWLKDKLFLRKTIENEFLNTFAEKVDVILFSEHHQSHAASAFFPSPFERAAILCLDGVGEWATTSAWIGNSNSLCPLWEIRFPHSIGLLYSAFTYYTGFKVNSGEYKVMGLAPYGRPVYVQKILDHLIDIKNDGTFRLNMEFFDYCAGLKMTNEKFDALFGGPPRKAESPLTQREMDLARSIQEVTEQVVLRLGRTIRKETGEDYLCLAGGVALNCVANGKLAAEKIFKEIWIQPAAGDAGGSLGCALNAYYQYFNKPRIIKNKDTMKGSYLGPEFEDQEIESYLVSAGANFEKFEQESLIDRVATDLSKGKVIGWMSGRMEFGPRALGARSIIGDARSVRMQSIMNLKIKYRESFRPFAPSILEEKVSEYFDFEGKSPYMLMVAPVNSHRRIHLSEEERAKWGIDLLNIPKSEIPAVTHVDYSARIQTVDKETHSAYYSLIQKFEEKTGCPVIVNTSFNVRGEPIVCTPEDAYRCFMRTEMDTLVLGNFILDKSMQPIQSPNDAWKKEFELD